MRAIGNDLHMDYSAVGQTTHLAARMEQLAIPGSIRSDGGDAPAGRRTCPGQRPGAGFRSRGWQTPWRSLSWSGPALSAGACRPAPYGGSPASSGGNRSSQALQQALERAGAGHGQVAAIVGEPGVGKSRLVYEFVHSHHTQGWLVLESASVSYGKATPYFPVIDLLKRYGHIEDHDDTRTIRAKITGQVLTLDEALQDTIPALLALLDALPEDHPFLKLDPPQRRRRTLDALKRILLRESQVQPLLLVFEDLHWIDSETQALLDSLVESLPTAQLLLLVNYRPEYQHGWGSKTYYTQLRLDPLPAGKRRGSPAGPAGNDRTTSLAPLRPKRCSSRAPRAIPSSWRRACAPWWRPGCCVGEPGAYRLAQALPTARRSLPRCRRCWRRASTGCHRRRNVSCRPPRSSARRCPCPSFRPSPRGLRRRYAWASRTCRPPSSSTRRACSPRCDYTFKHALTQQVAYEPLLQERRRRAPCPHRRGPRAARPTPGGRASRTPGASRPTGRGVG